MRILIFGAGAIGGVIGAMLSKENEVHMLVRPKHAEAINEKGLRVTGLHPGLYQLVAHDDLSDVPQPDIILVTVKAYSTQDALQAVSNFVPKAKALVALQNGLTVLRDFFPLPHKKAIIGITNLGAGFTDPGEVFFAGEGETYFGSLGKERETPEGLVDLFSKSGLKAKVSPDISADVWLKSIVNAAVNPITALLRCPNGAIARYPGLLQITKMVCAEGTAVAKAYEVELPVTDVFAWTKEIIDKTYQNQSSMLQDINRHKQTEIDQINGELVLRAETLEMDVPTIRTLWRLVKALEQGPF